MKRWILITVAVILVLALGACATPEEEEFVVRVAVENAYLPFNYLNPETGEPEGWDYEVWDEICRRLGCTPEYIETGWDGMIQAVADGQFDAAADGITITEERDEIVDFSVGYIALEQKLLVRADEDRISSIEDIVADESLCSVRKLEQQTTRSQPSTYLRNASRVLKPSPLRSRLLSQVTSMP